MLALLLAVAPAFATPGQDFDRGRKAYIARDWDSAFSTLNGLLYPKVELALKEDVWEAHVLLGAAAYERGDRQRAVEEFRKALDIDTSISITTNVHSAGVVQLYEDTKKQVIAEQDLAKKKREAEELQRKVREYVNTIGVYEKTSYGVNFLPFGAGQFQNKQKTKGYLVAGGMAVGGAVSVGAFLYLSTKYGVSAKVPIDEVDTVNRLQTIRFISGGVFWGFYIYSVVDAMVNYKASRLVKGDDSLLPAEFRDDLKTKPPAKPAKKASLRDRLHIGPFATSTGVGIGIGWETK